MTADRLPELALTCSPAGLCTGVDRIVDRIPNQALNIATKDGRRVVALGEPVHNKHESDRVRKMGISIIEDIELVEPDDVVITRAHGISPEVMEILKAKETTVLVGTCPLVEKSHMEVRGALKEAREQGTEPEIILIGSPNHPETIGILGEAPDNIHLIETLEDFGRLRLNPDKPHYVISQSTLVAREIRQMIGAIREVYPLIRTSRIEDICFATQNRQDAVEEVIRRGAQALFVLGDEHSSNTQSLRKFAAAQGVDAHLFPDVSQFLKEWILGLDIIGITAGASASPKRIVELRSHLEVLGVKEFREVRTGVNEPTFTSLAPVHDFSKYSNNG